MWIIAIAMFGCSQPFFGPFVLALRVISRFGNSKRWQLLESVSSFQR